MKFRKKQDKKERKLNFNIDLKCLLLYNSSLPFSFHFFSLFTLKSMPCWWLLTLLIPDATCKTYPCLEKRRKMLEKENQDSERIRSWHIGKLNHENWPGAKEEGSVASLSLPWLICVHITNNLLMCYVIYLFILLFICLFPLKCKPHESRDFFFPSAISPVPCT